MPVRRAAQTALFLITISIFFVCAGTDLIRYPGLQNDEVFFAPPIFFPQAAFYSVPIAGSRIPLMVMSYTGALKTWLYAAIFDVWAPTRWSVRIPMLIACLVVIWLTWLWARALGGKRTAIAATALLATDSMFLLTGIFDWGPVALQHLFLMAGLVCVTQFVRSGSRALLAPGFFIWGLGFWDKALLFWPLAGLAVGALCVFPREVRQRLKPANAAIAFVALIIGALPLAWYNIARHGETATANAVFSADDYAQKLRVLRGTFNGSILFGYMVENEAVSQQRGPDGRTERVSFVVRRRAGPRTTNWFLPVFMASLGALLLLRHSAYFRPMLFLLIAMVVGWLQMFLTHGAGGTAHHVVLLWPLPFVFVGLALAAITEALPRYGTAAFACVLSLLVIGNALNENEYLARFAIRGGIGGWTDAIYPLSKSLDNQTWVGAVDWGYLNGLRVLHGGRIKLFTPGNENERDFRRMVSNPGLLYVQHITGKEMSPGINEKLRKRAAEFGYSEKIERVVNDSSGAPVFEVFRFAPAQQDAALR